jgi:hypothetical protein
LASWLDLLGKLLGQMLGLPCIGNGRSNSVDSSSYLVSFQEWCEEGRRGDGEKRFYMRVGVKRVCR